MATSSKEKGEEVDEWSVFHARFKGADGKPDQVKYWEAMHGKLRDENEELWLKLKDEERKVFQRDCSARSRVHEMTLLQTEKNEMQAKIDTFDARKEYNKALLATRELKIRSLEKTIKQQQEVIKSQQDAIKNTIASKDDWENAKQRNAYLEATSRLDTACYAIDAAAKAEELATTHADTIKDLHQTIVGLVTSERAEKRKREELEEELSLAETIKNEAVVHAEKVDAENTKLKKTLAAKEKSPKEAPAKKAPAASKA